MPGIYQSSAPQQHCWQHLLGATESSDMENRNRLPGPLLSDERGLATVEYVIVLVTVILGLCAVLLTWWEPTLTRLAVQFAWLALPVP